MANTYLTNNIILKEVFKEYMNTNSLLKRINKQYSNQFAREGAKIGASLNIRLPTDYTTRTGPATQIQDSVDQKTTLTVNYQQGVDLSFGMADRTLNVEDFANRYISQAVRNLTATVASTIMTGAESIPNFVAAKGTNAQNVSNAVITPGVNQWTAAQGLLLDNGAEARDMLAMVDPTTNANAVSAFSGLFNQQQAIGEQYKTGSMVNRTALGFDWMVDQTVIKHTTGAYATTTINGAGQAGSSIAVNALTGPVSAGDVFTIAGVYAVNPLTKQSTGKLRQFTVTTAAATGATTLNIFPAIVPPVSAGVPIQFQSVTASPANGAAITFTTLAGETYRKNFIFVPEAITMATVDLEMPGGRGGNGVVDEARMEMDGLSMRLVSAYEVGTDQLVTRLDVLYGFLWIRPQWCCIVADQLGL